MGVSRTSPVPLPLISSLLTECCWAKLGQGMMVAVEPSSVVYLGRSFGGFSRGWPYLNAWAIRRYQHSSVVPPPPIFGKAANLLLDSFVRALVAFWRRLGCNWRLRVTHCWAVLIPCVLRRKILFGLYTHPMMSTFLLVPPWWASS